MANRQGSQRFGHTGLVIWFHGLGDSGTNWYQQLSAEIGPQVPWLKWSCPDAPRQPVTCNGGCLMPSWFDLRSIPVQHGEVHKGLDVAIARVHVLVKDAEKDGFPPNRVVLGGFSQGAALALHAGLTAAGNAVAGIVCFSGWVGSTTEMIRHTATPILMCHGTADQVVPIAVGRRSAELVQQAGCAGLRFIPYRGMEHSSSPEELADLVAFLRDRLPDCGPVLPREVQHGESSTGGAKEQLVSTVPTHRTLLSDGVCCMEIDIPCMDGLDVDISDSALRITGRFCLTASWPVPVDTSNSVAKFHRKKTKLIVRAHVK